MNFSKPKLLHYLTFLSWLFLASCGGSGTQNNAGTGTVTPPGGVAGANVVATSVENGAPLSSCPDNGITVNSGMDANGNRVLDQSEYMNRQYICHPPGGIGGLQYLIKVLRINPGDTHCPTGGAKVIAGPDLNFNRRLDLFEIRSSAYVCNGIPGTNGHDSLTFVEAVAVGNEFCAYGGTLVHFGLDDNNNGTLEPTEYDGQYYVCNGAPGATGPAGPGITWIDVTGTTQQAAVNKGYLANNAAQVAITLPAACAVGDLVQISGVGTGGWKAAQNAGQFISTKNLPDSYGALWTGHDSNRLWSSVHTSDTGQYMIAAVTNGLLYHSSDFGVTWTPLTHAVVNVNRNWTAVETSSDGAKLFAVASPGRIYYSGDFGATWTESTDPDVAVDRNWTSLATDVSGTKLIAAASGGQLYTSTDSGVTWTPQETVRDWRAVASSADGIKLVAAVFAGYLYTSPDSGATWTPRDSPRAWTSVGSSADGTKLVASAFGEHIYTSIDSGVLWTPRDVVRFWNSVHSSADGTKLVAAANTTGGHVYTSTDSGVNWMTRGAVGDWKTVASSADGSMLVGAVTNGLIYTSVQTTTPGVLGSITGGQYDALDLQCIAGNNFMVRAFLGVMGIH